MSRFLSCFSLFFHVLQFNFYSAISNLLIPPSDYFISDKLFSFRNLIWVFVSFTSTPYAVPPSFPVSPQQALTDTSRGPGLVAGCKGNKTRGTELWNLVQERPRSQVAAYHPYTIPPTLLWAKPKRRLRGAEGIPVLFRSPARGLSFQCV